MPAYDRPIDFVVDHGPRGDDRVAAVIKFNPEIAGPEELERIKAFLARLQERGIIEGASWQVYDASVCEPVLYFP